MVWQVKRHSALWEILAMGLALEVRNNPAFVQCVFVGYLFVRVINNPCNKKIVKKWHIYELWFGERKWVNWNRVNIACPKGFVVEFFHLPTISYIVVQASYNTD